MLFIPPYAYIFLPLGRSRSVPGPPIQPSFSSSEANPEGEAEPEATGAGNTYNRPL